MPKQPAAPTDAEVERALTTAPVAESTRRAYGGYVRAFANRGTTVERALGDPAEFATWVRALPGTLQSRRFHANFAMNMIKHCHALRDWLGEDRCAALRALRDELDGAVAELIDSSALTARLQAGWVPWADLVRARDGAPRGSQERALLHLYIPDLAGERGPVRRDLDRVRIVRTEAAGERAGGNVLVLPAAHGHKPATLVVREHKTQHAFGALRAELEPACVAAVRESLEARPRAWLFTPRGLDKPFASDLSFGHWANRALRRAAGNDHISLATLRHIFLSEKSFASLGERRRVAASMGHNVMRSLEYVKRV